MSPLILLSTYSLTNHFSIFPFMNGNNYNNNNDGRQYDGMHREHQLITNQ